MKLDVPTLMAMESFVTACCGAILLMAYSSNRKISSLGVWALSDFLVASGIFALMLGGALDQLNFFVVAGTVLVLAQGLQWRAARTFDGKPAPFILVVLGAAIVGGSRFIPGIDGFSSSLGLTFSAVYLFAVAVTLWPQEKPRLPARWPIIGLTVVHATILSIGAYSTFNMSLPHGMMPPLMSSFGLIHFESIIYSTGMAVFLLALVKERSEAVSRIAAGIDSLTGIANRAGFLEAGTRLIAQCKRADAPVAVIMFDLDGFKIINDTHGHAVGDDAIRKFCEVTIAALRPGDVFGRLGGEEFAVVMGRSSIEPAYVRAERIRVAFASEARMIGDKPINATVSGGVAVSAQAENTLSELLKFSDEALYRAKAAGRNRIRRAGQLALEGGSATVIRVA